MSLVLANPTAPLQPGITTTPRAQGGGGSNISDPHPDYIARRPDWVLCFDCNEGQRHIKSKTTTYLPATSGMRALGLNSGDEGLALYEAYLIRAFFPDLMKETVRALTGILDREPANIELPDALEDMRELATPKGESLNDLLVQIHINQLLYGRLGLLLDVDPNRDLLGWIVTASMLDGVGQRLVHRHLDLELAARGTIHLRHDRHDLLDHRWDRLDRAANRSLETHDLLSCVLIASALSCLPVQGSLSGFSLL